MVAGWLKHTILLSKISLIFTLTTCPSDLLKHCQSGHCICYKNGVNKNWNQAESACKDQGSTLPVIKSVIQWTQFRQHFPPLNADKFWIGLHFLSEKEGWRWMDGTTFIPEIHWGPWADNEPELENGKCVQSSGPDYKWRMAQCSSTSYKALCAMKLEPVILPPPFVPEPTPEPITGCRQPNIDFGYVTHTSEVHENMGETAFNKTVTHHCVRDATLPTGASVVNYLCQPNGTWSVTPQPCSPYCTESITEIHLNYTSEATNVTNIKLPALGGTTVVHECADKAYFPDYSTKKIYKCQHREWTTGPDPPACEPATLQCYNGLTLVSTWCLTDAGAGNWDSAEKTCRDMKLYKNSSASMIKMDNISQWELFKEELIRRDLPSVWLYVRYDFRYEPYDYKWGDKDKSEIDFDPPWANHEPRTPTNQQSVFCAFAERGQNNDYQWRTKSCEEKNDYFICAGRAWPAVTTTSTTTSTSTTPTTTTTVTKKITTELICAADEEKVDGRCYPRPEKIDPNTWHIVKEKCGKLSPKYNRMASAFKKEEQWTAFNKLRRDLNIGDIWLGLSFNLTFWIWEDGSIFDVDNDWGFWPDGEAGVSNNPNHHEYCIYSTASAQHYKWRTDRCDASHAGACYKVPGPTTTTEPTTSTTTTDPFEGMEKEIEPTPVFDKKEGRNFAPEFMTEVEKTVTVAVQTVGCTWIIASLASVVGLYILFSSYQGMSMLILCQDIALLTAHILIATVREPTLSVIALDSYACVIVAGLLHYFFLVGYMFMFLEGLQSMAVCGNIIHQGLYFSSAKSLMIGWGLPLLYVISTAIGIGSDYANAWTCWGDLESPVVYPMFISFGLVCGAALTCSESGGILSRKYNPLKFRDEKQIVSAAISRTGLPIVLLITLAAHGIGMGAVFLQQAALYAVCMALNIANAIAVFSFHTAMDIQIRTFVQKWVGKIFSCCKKQETLIPDME